MRWPTKAREGCSFLKKRTKRLLIPACTTFSGHGRQAGEVRRNKSLLLLFFRKEGLFFLAFLLPAGAACADDAGRDFPKTLIFDEPGIDDEVSLPTVLFVPQDGAHEADVEFELDKRLTTRLSLQINVGYTELARIGEASAGGWQDSTAALKLIVFADRAMEQLVSLSVTRAFGASGARRVGSADVGSTLPALNFGQGFAALAAMPLLRPLAVTGVAGMLVPDSGRDGAVRQALLSASLQYSFDVLARSGGDVRVPGFMRPLIPIVEFSYATPAAAHATLAPGLIYSGGGYQVAAEALVPLTRASGTHVGMIAQLNISLSVLGIAALTRPLL